MSSKKDMGSTRKGRKAISTAVRKSETPQDVSVESYPNDVLEAARMFIRAPSDVRSAIAGILRDLEKEHKRSLKLKSARKKRRKRVRARA